MKVFKYLFFLIVLVFVVGSLYVATISLPSERQIKFETTVNPQLIKLKTQDLSTYENWFSFPEKPTSEYRLSNTEDLKDASLSWRNKNFESINFQNQFLSETSLTQLLKLKTWLSTSEFEISWKFDSSDNTNFEIIVETDIDFWNKAEYAITGISHLDMAVKAMTESLNALQENIIKEIAVYSISSIGKVDTGGFYSIHATSASRLNFETILKKSQPFFESIEGFMEDQSFEVHRGRLIVFENLFSGSDNIIFSSGVGSKNKIAIPEYFEVLTQNIPRSTYFKTQLKGNHSNLKELLSMSESALKKRNLEVDSSLKPFLEFEIDFNQSINPADWVTNLYIPIQDN